MTKHSAAKGRKGDSSKHRTPRRRRQHRQNNEEASLDTQSQANNTTTSLNPSVSEDELLTKTRSQIPPTSRTQQRIQQSRKKIKSAAVRSNDQHPADPRFSSYTESAYSEQLSEHWKKKSGKDEDPHSEASEGVLDYRSHCATLRSLEDQEGAASLDSSEEMPYEDEWRPGAYAFPGMDTEDQATERRDTLQADIGGGPRSDLDQLSEGIIITEQPPLSKSGTIEDKLPETSSVRNMTTAKRIDDAEPVFLAEDVQHDNRQRLVRFAALLLVSVAAVLTTVLLVLRSNDDAPPCLEGDVCCKPTEEMNAMERCSCFNDTLSAYDELPDSGQQVYDFLQESYLNSTMWQEYANSEDLDPYSCHPLNQILLQYGAEDGFGFTLEQIQGISYSLINSVTTLMWVFIDLDGALWTRNDLWGTSLICDWYGVGCLFLGIRHELKLSSNGLRGALPESLSWVPELRNIDLSQNQITGTIPPQLSWMSQLTSLQLSDLELTGEIPAELGDLSRLGILDLEENGLTGSIPPSIFEMPSLREFEVSHNAISGSFPTNTTYTASRLAIFRANHNQLTGTLPDELENLSRLELLNLEQNSLSGTIPDFLGRMPNLQFVNLYESGLTGSIPETFCERPDYSGAIEIIADCQVVGLCSCCSFASEAANSLASVLLQCGDTLPVYSNNAEL